MSAPSSPADGRLDSWKDIAAYLRRDVSTVQRWEKHEGLPVRRHFHRKTGSVYAYRSDIDEWWRRRALRMEGSSQQPQNALPEECDSARAGSPGAGSRFVLATATVVLLAAAVTQLDTRWSDGYRAGDRSAIRSIAVLPLLNLSSDTAQDHLADGMTEAIVNSLAQIGTLRVASRTAVARFAGARRPLSEIARDLDVDAIVEGSVQHEGDRLQIRVQLVDGRSDTYLWARDYEGRRTEVLRLQNEVGGGIARAIGAELLAGERPVTTPGTQIDPAAYQEYVVGRHHMSKQNETDVVRAIDHFERAARIAPQYAAAYAALSNAWWVRGVWGAKTLTEVESASRAAAQMAMASGREQADALVSFGRIKYTYDRNWPSAEADFRRALAIDPDHLDAHYFYAMLLMGLGRHADSVRHIERAAQLDPLSSMVESGFGRVLYRARRYDEAVDHLHRAIALEPRNHGAFSRLGDVHYAMGRYDQALSSYGQAHSAGLSDRGYAVKRARVYARTGRAGEARRILRDVLDESETAPLEVAAVHAAMEESDRAFEVLFRAAEEASESLSLIFLKEEPALVPLHSDARWKALMVRLNLALPSHDAGVALTRLQR